MKYAVAAAIAAASAFAADWDAVRSMAPDTKVQVTTADKSGVSGKLVRATADSIVVATKKGEVSTAVANVRVVKVADASKRARNGIIGTAIGLGAGLAIGFAVCPGCSGEGVAWKYTGPGAAMGAAAGAAAGFLPLPYRTIYRAPRR